MKNIDTSFFNLSTIKLPVDSGDLLVAEPFLSEQWFNRAVISVIDHDDREGTTGVVLNLPLGNTLAEVLDGVTREDPVTVYCGGPLSQDRLYFIHTLGDKVIRGARQYSPGLWIGGDFQQAVDYVNEGYPIDSQLRFFVGYSGWAPGQLREELEANTWAVRKAIANPSTLLKGQGAPYWHNIVRDMGEHYRSWTLLPQDPRAN